MPTHQSEFIFRFAAYNLAFPQKFPTRAQISNPLVSEILRHGSRPGNSSLGILTVSPFSSNLSRVELIFLKSVLQILPVPHDILAVTNYHICL